MVTIIQDLDESLWKDIPDYKNYQAHPSGEIRNKTNKRVLKVESNKHEYRITRIEKKSTSIHVIIAKTFCENDDPSKKTQVNHKDSNKRNNNANNLEWISPSDNVKHAISKGRKDGKPALRPIRVKYRDGTVNNFNSVQDAATNTEISKCSIFNSIKKHDGAYYGVKGVKDITKLIPLYVFEYINTPIIDDKVVFKKVSLEGFTHLIAYVDGRLYNDKHKQITGTDDGRYIRVKSRSKGNISTGFHRIIADTFIPNTENKPYVNHKDGNTRNNMLSNLEWSTQKENMQHAISTGLISNTTRSTGSNKCKVPVYQLELDGSIIKQFDSLTCAELYGGLTGLSSICNCYLGNRGKHIAHSSGGYGWCFVENYRGLQLNESFKSLFPEITDTREINFNILRTHVIRGSRPVWQIDIDGKRLKIWESMIDAKNSIPNNSNIYSSLQSKGSRLSGGYFWEYLSYDQIVNPHSNYIPKIPEIIKKSLGIPENSSLILKPSITQLLRENISGDILRIRTKPFTQLNLDDTIVKLWSGPYKATRELGYTRNSIERVLYGNQKSFSGYKWKWLTLEEMCEPLIDGQLQ